MADPFANQIQNRNFLAPVGFKFTLASEPNGYGWKSEINKLINKLVFSK